MTMTLTMFNLVAFLGKLLLFFIGKPDSFSIDKLLGVSDNILRTVTLELTMFILLTALYLFVKMRWTNPTYILRQRLSTSHTSPHKEFIYRHPYFLKLAFAPFLALLTGVYLAFVPNIPSMILLFALLTGTLNYISQTIMLV